MGIGIDKQFYVNVTTAQAIEQYPDELSHVLKLTTLGIKDVQQPQKVKMVVTNDEKSYLHNSTAWDSFKSFLLSLIFWIPYEKALNTVEKKAADSRKKSELIAGAGIDHRNQSRRMESLYRFPVPVVKDFTELAKELAKPSQLADASGYLHFKDNDDLILCSSHLKTDQGRPTYQIVANSKGLFCYTGNEEPTKLMSLQDYNTSVTLRKLKSQLTPEARIKFEPFFDLHKIGLVDNKSPIVVSGNVGDVCMIILGIQAGSFELLDKEAISVLATMINAEGSPEGSSDEEWTNKKKEDWNALAEKFKDKLKYQKGGAPVIVNGGIADTPISLEMIKQGAAVFIAGPNAVEGLPEAMESIPEETKLKYKDYKPYTNAYYDQATNKLYLPHGIRFMHFRLPDDRIATAFGEYPKDISEVNVQNFVEWLNKKPLPKSELQEEVNKFETFEASNAEIQKLGEKLKVTIVRTGKWVMDPAHTNVVTLHAWKHREDPNFVGVARIGAEDKKESAKENGNLKENGEPKTSIDSATSGIDIEKWGGWNTNEIYREQPNNQALGSSGQIPVEISDPSEDLEGFSTTKFNGEQDNGSTIIIKGGQPQEEDLTSRTHDGLENGPTDADQNRFSTLENNDDQGSSSTIIIKHGVENQFNLGGMGGNMVGIIEAS